MVDVAGLARVLMDLDRCEHGRHSADRCFDCPEGRSAGNPYARPGTRIGTDVYGRPIVVPGPDRRLDPEAWIGD